jgi:hypothetical protein
MKPTKQISDKENCEGSMPTSMSEQAWQGKETHIFLGLNEDPPWWKGGLK